MSRGGRWILALLVASIFIDYVDRGSLSIAAPLLEKELALSPLQLGQLLGALFWTNALCQLCGLAGWLADRFPVGLALAAGFAAMFAARLLLGAGESVAYPCYSRILASGYPQETRGPANALLDAGSKLGPGIARILRCPTAWGTFLAHFCGNYFWFFLLTWLPSCLLEECGCSIEGIAAAGSAADLTIAAAVALAGAALWRITVRQLQEVDWEEI